MTEGLDAITAQVKAAESKIDAVALLIPTLKSTISELQLQLSEATNQDPALVALAADLKSHVDGLDAALNPPPAPDADPNAPV